MGKDKPIVIYGAGKFGRKLYEKLKELGIEVTCFLDRAAFENQTLFGIPVYRMDDISISMESKAKCKVVIAVTVSNNEIRNIKSNLINQGYKEVFFNNIFFLYFNNVFINEFKDMNILEYKNEIIKACNLLEDNHSRRIFTSSIRTRAT